MRNMFLKGAIKELAFNARRIRKRQQSLLEKGRVLKENSEREEAEKVKQEDLEGSEKFYSLYKNLQHRRTHELRKEARCSLIAYGFLNGFEYGAIEQGAKEPVDWDKVSSLAFKFNTEFTPIEFNQRFEEWMQKAKGITGPDKVAN